MQMQRFSSGQEQGEQPANVRWLLERVPAVAEDGWVDLALDHFDLDPGLEWVAVVDTENRPVALAGRPLGLTGEPRLAGVDRIEPDVSVTAAARAAIERPPSERMVPFLRCDSHGRYVAVVRTETLVAALAEAHERASTRSPAS
jgi:hypothetical protein